MDTLGSKIDGASRKMLTHCEDGAGRRYLSKGCCSGSHARCTRLRRFVMCAVDSERRPCVNQPDKVWVCLPIACPPGSPSEYVIKWRNACYRVSDPAEEIGASEVRPNETVLRNDQGSDPAFNYQCLPSCSDPACTECLIFIKCDPCTQNAAAPQPGNPPDVYILRQLVTRCGSVGRFTNAQGGIWCFTVRPDGPTFRREQFPAGAQETLGPVDPNTDCCDCQDGCGGSTVHSIYDCDLDANQTIRCCCTDSYTGSFTFDSWQRVYLEPSQDYAEWRASGSAAFTRILGQPETMTPDHFTGIQRNFFADGTQIGADIPYDITQLPRLFCGSDVQIGSLAAGGRPLPGCPRTAATGITIDTYVSSVTCFNGLYSVSWRGFQHTNGTISEEGRFTLRWQINPVGACPGNCGRSLGATPGAPVLSQPVPFDQWPAWASMIAKLKADGDTGVGSTVERLVNATGPVTIVVKKALEMAVKDCGCNRRRSNWDRMYPY